MTHRQIVLDTETTGLKPEDGARIIEIGCVELLNRRITGNNYHTYINPECKIEKGALEVHGITNEFLDDKPTFDKVIDEFLSYIDGSELIIHNAPFDVGFLNYELKHYLKHSKKVTDYATIFDTLPLARKKHPGQRNNLDALCKRYNVDNKNRNLHGALLDAELLAKVYLAMTSGQFDLFSQFEFTENPTNESLNQAKKIDQENLEPLKIIYANSDEKIAHKSYLEMLAKQSGKNCLWEGNDND